MLTNAREEGLGLWNVGSRGDRPIMEEIAARVKKGDENLEENNWILETCLSFRKVLNLKWLNPITAI